MKKKILLAISMVLLLIAIVVCSLFDAQKSGKLTVADAKTIEKIKAKLVDVNSKNDEFANLKFDLQFEGESLPYDAASHTFYLPINMEKADWEVGAFSGAFFDAPTDAQQSGDASSTDATQNDNASVTDAHQSSTNSGGSLATASKLLWIEDFHEFNKQSVIANGQAFDFYAVTSKYYGQYHLVFTGLPMISFTGSGYMADDGTQMFIMRVYDVDHSTDWVTTSYTQAGLRGNTSLTYEKKSLRLYLKDLQDDGTFVKNNKNLLGLRDDDDWILNSLYGDPSRIRDQLAIDLWNEVGATSNPYGKNFGTQSKMVEVVIADGYQGIYDLMVPIDAKQLGIEATSIQLAKANSNSATDQLNETIDELKTDESKENESKTDNESNATVIERIYKKKYSAPFVSEDYIGQLPDANSPDARGGFYLKGDTILQNEEEWKPLYDLSAILEASQTYNSEEMLIDIASASDNANDDFVGEQSDNDEVNGSDDETPTTTSVLFGEKSGVDVVALTALVDQQNLIENWLFYQAIASFDNENKNYYYVVKNKNNKPYGYFIPWDMNISFGEVYADNVYFTEEDGTTIDEIVTWEPGQSLVTSGDKNVTADLKATWKAWRKTTFSNEEMLERVHNLEHQVMDSGAFARENYRWPNGNQDFDFTALEVYMLDRLEFVDVLVDDLQ